MKFSIWQRANIGFGLLLLILGTISVASYRSTTMLIEANQWVAHTHEVLGDLQTVLSLIQDAEIGQRGYLLTGRESYLKPHSTAVEGIDDVIARVRKLTADNPNQQRRLDTLRPLIAGKLAELKETIELRKSNGFQAALAVVVTDRGKKAMDDIREVVRQMEDEERELLKSRDQSARTSARNENLAISFGTLLAFVLVPFASVVIRNEIVQRKRAEEAIVCAKEEAERASKFKDQFLSTMSHELRTPLNAVLGFSGLLADERYGPLNERQQRYVSHIQSGGQHLLKLVSDILDLSKIEAGRMDLAIENVPVANAFSEVLSALRPLAEKKSQILSQDAEPSLAVRADATRFKQVLMNLVGNAIKFTPEGGRIELLARLIAGQVRMEVRDTGPGIPPEEQERIFEAFYRLRQTGKATDGTGLGLAITQRLVELHGGQLALESESGRGSCFYFGLPVVEVVRRPLARRTERRPSASESPRILVMEDDAAAAQLIYSQLTSSGYEAVLCEELGRAAELAAELQPDAITLDILMKPTSGWELLLQLKNDPRTASIPVIVLTVVDQPAMGMTLGADEYLVKPVEKAALLAAVERCIAPRGTSPPPRPILVVEDDGPTREVIAELLTAAGYAMATVADGAQARAWGAGSLPELVILDLMLPKVSGFELLAEWRATSRTADLPVFVLTSKDLSQEEEKYLRAHAESLWRKQEPWQETLIKQLRRVLGRGQPVKI